jgi:hypothetical protein
MVFVVEVGQISLAFKAGTETQAMQIAGSHWFTRALDCYCVNTSRSGRATPRLRTATTREFVLFHDMSAEFAGAAAEFLVARVG